MRVCAPINPSVGSLGNFAAPRAAASAAFCGWFVEVLGVEVNKPGEIQKLRVAGVVLEQIANEWNGAGGLSARRQLVDDRLLDLEIGRIGRDELHQHVDSTWILAGLVDIGKVAKSHDVARVGG